MCIVNYISSLWPLSLLKYTDHTPDYLLGIPFKKNGLKDIFGPFFR